MNEIVSKSETSPIKTIDEILERETTQNNKATWTKLDKTSKVSKLSEYAKRVSKEKGLDETDCQELSKYLSDALERKRLLSVKDVSYDNTTGEITKIHCLTFLTNANRKFTLKRGDKRVSTLKSLGPGKSRKKADKSEKSEKTGKNG